MCVSEESLLFLNDAIDRIIANPAASHCWQNLMNVSCGITDPEVLTQAVSHVQSSLPSAGLAGFYREMYLDIATGEAKHIAEAGRILKSIQPVDADRMAAFHSLYWQKALVNSRDRGEFIHRLRNGCLPDIAHLIGQAIANYELVLPQLRAIDQIGKVAVVVPHLITKWHPPTLMAIEQATVLMQHGIEVNLFSCQEAVVPEVDHLLGNRSLQLPEAVNLDDWLASVNNEAKVYVSDPRFSLVRRGVDMLKIITKFDPDLIMIIGLHSCLAPALYGVRPVLSLGINSAPPMVPADVWLSAQKELHNKLTAVWEAKFPECLAWYHPYRIRRKQHTAAMLRADLDVHASSVVLISVGSDLPIKIAGAWATQMNIVLRNNPEAVWLLVGGKAELPEMLKNTPQAQVRLFPFSFGIRAILACCDIYINPPIMGGGFSVAEAMAEGLPVLTYAGSDGGDKADNEAVRSDSEYFSKLDTLIKDGNLRIEIGKRMREQFDRTLDLANSGPNLIAACEEALKRYQQRVID